MGLERCISGYKHGVILGKLYMLDFRGSIQHVASTKVSALCQVLLMLNALLAVWYIDQNEEANHLVTRKSIVSQGRPGGV